MVLCSASLPFHLERYLETNESLVRQLLDSTYVDDIISGGDTEDEVFDLYTKLKKVFSEGGFNPRKFLTSSPRVQEQIDLQESQTASGSRDRDEPTFSEATLGVSRPQKAQEHKVLGVPWNPEADQLIVDIADLAR